MRKLAGLGSVQLALYLVIASLSLQFVPGEGFLERPILEVVGLFEINFALYLLSIWLVARDTKKVESGSKRNLAVILFFAVAFRITLLFSTPIQEVDIYRYLWDGRVLSAGINPFAYSPAEVDGADTSSTNELLKLKQLASASPAIATIFARIHFRDVPTVYPPVSQVVFATAAIVTPARSSFETHLLVMKFLLVGFDLATIGIVCLLLRSVRMSISLCLIYAWSPLVMKEIANSGHLDSIAVMLTTLTIYLLVRSQANDEIGGGRSLGQRHGLDVAAAVCWGLATLAKFYPVVLGPLLGVWWWRRYRWSMIVPVLAYILTIGTIHFAFRPEVGGDGRSLEGVSVFLAGWEMNDLLFAAVIENLDPHAVGPGSAWFSVLPLETRQWVISRCQELALRCCGSEVGEFEIAFLLARGITAMAYGLIVLSILFRPWQEEPSRELLHRTFLCLGWFWFFIPTQNPWYWTWALPFVVFASWPWLLVSGAALLYYLRFWFEYHYAVEVVGPTPYIGLAFFDYVVVWLEHLPMLLLILACGGGRRKSWEKKW